MEQHIRASGGAPVRSEGRRWKPLLVAALRFGAVLGAGLLILARSPEGVMGMQKMAVRQTVWALRQVGYSAFASNEYVMFRGAAFRVTPDCLILYPCLVLVAAFAAFSLSWRRALWGLCLAIPASYLVNQARLITIGMAMVHDRALATFVHDYLWRALLFGWYLGLWFVWHRWQRGGSVAPGVQVGTSR